MAVMKKPKPRRTSPTQHQATGIIERGVIYPQNIFCAILGVSRHVVRDMKNRGLKIRKDGRRPVILGDDYIAYASKLPVSQ